jgi:hypothetical protein
MFFKLSTIVLAVSGACVLPHGVLAISGWEKLNANCNELDYDSFQAVPKPDLPFIGPNAIYAITVEGACVYTDAGSQSASERIYISPVFYLDCAR